jgi:hypothetical protein
MQTLVPKQVLTQHLPRDLIIDYDLCPDCFEPLLELPDGVKICRKCGGEYHDGGQVENDRVPLPQQDGNAKKTYFEGHWSPPNELAFDKNLGTSTLIPVKAICKIISGGDNRDLGIRARLVKIVATAGEPHQLHNCLEYASTVLKQLNFNQNMIIGNAVGAMLRKVVAYLLLTKVAFRSREVADATVFYVLKKFGFWPDPSPRMHGEYVETNVLRFHKKYLEVCELLDRKLEGF